MIIVVNLETIVMMKLRVNKYITVLADVNNLLMSIGREPLPCPPKEYAR